MVDLMILCQVAVGTEQNFLGIRRNKVERRKTVEESETFLVGENTHV